MLRAGTSAPHRPLIAMLFANDTWGSKFDWLLQGDDDTTFSLGQVSERLSNPAFASARRAARTSTGRGHAGLLSFG